MDHFASQGNAEPSPMARGLGYAGLIPFVGLAAAAALSPLSEAQWASGALLGYGVTIASFLGAIHWGLAMRSGGAQPAASLAWGVAPSLLGWSALLLGSQRGLVLLVVLLWLCFGADRLLYPHYRLQAWLRLRLVLTVVASASCLVAAFAPAR